MLQLGNNSVGHGSKRRQEYLKYNCPRVKVGGREGRDEKSSRVGFYPPNVLEAWVFYQR
jgi:hypothetical protein